MSAEMHSNKEYTNEEFLFLLESPSDVNVEFRNDFIIISPISWTTQVRNTSLTQITENGAQSPQSYSSASATCASIERGSKLYRMDEKNPPPNITAQQIEKAKKCQKFHLKRKYRAEKTKQYNDGVKELTGMFPKIVNNNGNINPEIVIEVTEKVEQFRELIDIMLQMERAQDPANPRGRQSKKKSPSV